MALVGQIVVESRRYSGWLDPRYPIGYWQAALTVTGDATGGALSIDLVFQGAVSGVLNSQMYSVERFAIFSEENANRIVGLQAVNMGGPDNEGFTGMYAIQMLSIQDVGSFGAANARDTVIVPWFLGSQRRANLTASLSLTTQNIDTIPFKLEAEGYRWSARSVLVDGGPQRPPTGPYRS